MARQLQQSQPSPPTVDKAAQPSAVEGQPASSISRTTRDQDTPLTVAQQVFHFVTHTRLIEHAGPRSPDEDETVERWELVDPAGKVLYQESYQATQQGDRWDFTTTVSAQAFSTRLGSGVLVRGDSLPSDPGSGGWTQFFGLSNGKLASFGPPINANEYLGLDTDPKRGGADVAKFRLWTGNFNIIYPVLINWNMGRLEPAWRCFRGPVTQQVERCPYEVKVDAAEVKEQTFVRLYDEAEDTGKPRHVVVQPGSRIEFVQAEVHVSWHNDAANSPGNFSTVSLSAEPGDIWLKIRVDGKEGWIHSQEDFDAVGLPLAG